ncbi:MAG: ArsR family transcriptional regulator [Thermodesulfobacteriota bacterium]|nr:ArsR family transcriptional regulator [Thermodesulfobacteriota bacterium]
MQTIRRQIIELLQQGPMVVREISQEIGIMEKEVFGHLEHIRFSIKAAGKKLNIDPAVCLDCNYSFKDRKRVKHPGRCPKCKSTHIRKPEYSIR